jgi:L-aspartate oxidase
MVASEAGIEVLERTSAFALWSDGERCHGVVADHHPVAAAATVLATGGAAALWRRTTNPRGAIGAGMVLASAAGADLADLEFCQFHPTALHLPGTPHDGKLITEAIRGEGAQLLDASGERFTDELAPRDAVTRAMLEQMRAEGSDSVLLDLRGIDPARFPNVFAALDAAGLDARSAPVPVSPAAHYMMGGVAVDLDGRSSLPGLLAVGETSCTGLHGANRLASNSLSECFVFGGRAAAAAVAETAAPAAARPEPPAWRFDPPSTETRAAVWRYAGPVRNPDDLARLISNPYPLARALATSALDRRESRGGHLRADAPEIDPALDGIHVVVEAGGGARHEAWD